MIPFHVPAVTGEEEANLRAAIASGSLSGDGPFTRSCHAWLEDRLGCTRSLMTPSAGSAFDLACLLLNLGPGDEVLMPSFAGAAAANAVGLRGATPVFLDLRADTLNLDEQNLETAINARTRAIVVLHYAAVSSAMDVILEVARRHGLPVIEDATAALLATWNGRALGTLGSLGVLSFHESRNVHCGEGGALLINDPALVERAEILREEGTNRMQFHRRQVQTYGWQELGGAFMGSELGAAFLMAQLDHASLITEDRRATWSFYADALGPCAGAGKLELPAVPAGCRHNGHGFHVRLADPAARVALARRLEERGVSSRIHYMPLHGAPAGRRFGRMHGEDRCTTREAGRLLRLPLYWKMPRADAQRVVDAVTGFFD